MVEIREAGNQRLVRVAEHGSQGSDLLGDALVPLADGTGEGGDMQGDMASAIRNACRMLASVERTNEPMSEPMSSTEGE